MIGDQACALSGQVREFGELFPVRPATGKPTVGLRGHRLDLDLYEKLAPVQPSIPAARHALRGVPRAGRGVSRAGRHWRRTPADLAAKDSEGNEVQQTIIRA